LALDKHTFSGNLLADIAAAGNGDDTLSSGGGFGSIELSTLFASEVPERAIRADAASL